MNPAAVNLKQFQLAACSFLVWTPRLVMDAPRVDIKTSMGSFQVEVGLAVSQNEATSLHMARMGRQPSDAANAVPSRSAGPPASLPAQRPCGFRTPPANHLLPQFLCSCIKSMHPRRAKTL